MSAEMTKVTILFQYKKRNLQTYGIIVFIGAMLVFFQACSTTQNLQRKPDTLTRTTPNNGIAGGSITVAESKRVYEYNRGKFDHVQQNYDDVNRTTVIDLLSPEAPLEKITSRARPTQQFILLLINGAQNPGAILEINEDFYYFEEYAKMSAKYLGGDRSALPKLVPNALRKLKIHLDFDAVTGQKIVRSRLDCVESNLPGPKREYRNGAPTVQALVANHKYFDPFMKTATQNSEILHELTFFVDDKSKCQ